MPLAVGEPNGCGVVFTLSPDGSSYTVLHFFAGDFSEGAFPSSGLVFQGGNLFGTTPFGGGDASRAGVVFKLSPDGTSYKVLHSFAFVLSDGAVPSAGLIADSSGNLYGTTAGGGASRRGVVFMLSQGGTLTLLHSFAGGASDGADPAAGLIADGNGNLYGTTSQGGGPGCGGFGCGVVFKLSPGGTLTLLHSFAGGASDGAVPASGLITDNNGNLYGTTSRGGASDKGVVFKLSPSGLSLGSYSYSVLYSFTGGSDGGTPFAGLIADGAGNLYGTTVGGGASNAGTVFKISPDGTETVLHSFSGSDGANPQAGLIADGNGNLYGTTNEGGASNVGVVFELTGTGFVTETVFYPFCSKPNCSDGARPHAGLIADSNGDFYGTTVNGDVSFAGTVFKLTPGGTETVLQTFTGGSDGRFPVAGLIADSSGNLYGTTLSGGALGGGVVFKLSPSGAKTVLYPFCSKPSCTDGAGPEAGLISDRKGNLYGTTAGGGASGNGVVFKLSLSGTSYSYSVLYSFTGGSDGGSPYAGLTADGAGNLYGTTVRGGASGVGVVFRLSPSGAYTVLHNFCGLPLCSDGANPQAGLIADSKGNFYGTTVSGGASGGGVVFELSPSGTETVLYSFCSKPSCSDGYAPAFSGLIIDGSGNLYGTTIGGGAFGSNGTVFKVSPSGTETVLYSFCSKPSCTDGALPFTSLIADSNGNLYGTTFYGGASGFCSGIVSGCGVVFKLTGTGFVTAVPFASFRGSYVSPNANSVDFYATFTLESTSKGISPSTEPVTLQIGTFNATIPAGSFKGSRSGTFTFNGVMNGVSMQVLVRPAGAAGQYDFHVKTQNLSLPAIGSPIPLTLTIGFNTGHHLFHARL